MQFLFYNFYSKDIIQQAYTNERWKNIMCINNFLDETIQSKYALDQVAIEVTRGCNMGCAHCLRGNAQNINIQHRYIDSLLQNVENIGSIVFTGGEPSLNIDAIDYTLQKCQELNISVGSFYIVTNGKENVLPLCVSALKWYAYCDEREMCGLALSRDKFHAAIAPDNESILRGLAFFVEDKFTDFDRVNLVSEGRAEGLNGYKKTDVDMHCDSWSFEEYDGVTYVGGMVYLSANGEIRDNCDTAFDNLEYTIGDLNHDTFDYLVKSQSIGETLPF